MSGQEGGEVTEHGHDAAEYQHGAQQHQHHVLLPDFANPTPEGGGWLCRI